jgi:hypothetical protein
VKDANVRGLLFLAVATSAAVLAQSTNTRIANLSQQASAKIQQNRVPSGGELCPSC